MPDDNANRVVSFDDESLILVDSNNTVLGHKPKVDCHRGNGILHRAFSIFLFNSAGDIMLQQRSRQKQLWPGYWSNSCCSHPRRGETVDQAAARRLYEELAAAAPLVYLYRFEYHARFHDIGSEHELCTVYAARSDAPIHVNANEVADWHFTAPEVLDRELQHNPQNYTPWLQLEWPRIRASHWHQVIAA